MSIWTFRAATPLALSLSILSGCLDAPGFGATAPQTVAVAQSSVVIGGPKGYCIDRSASRLNGDSAFVLLGSCAAITRKATVGGVARPAVLTASVTREPGDGPGLLADPAALKRYVASPAGRAALARDTSPDSVRILGTIGENGAFLIHLRDSSQAEIPGMEQTYWRGLTELNGRLVAVSVLGFADRPLNRTDGLALLRAFLARIRAETLARN